MTRLLLASPFADEAAQQILDYVATAELTELPGLEAALRCILSADERPAHEIVREFRARGLSDARILELLEGHEALPDLEHALIEQEAARRRLGMDS